MKTSDLLNTKNIKEYTIQEIEEFYNNNLTYKEYKEIREKTKKQKINLYLKYYQKQESILKYLKSKINEINKEEYYKDKKILSIHIKAIIESKKIPLENKKNVEEYGFEYGWLDKDNYIQERFYECGKNLIKKFKDFNVSLIYDKDIYTKYAQYSEWRKLVWMKIYLLIKDVDKKYLKEYIKKEE
jgi:hypothetical protein